MKSAIAITLSIVSLLCSFLHFGAEGDMRWYLYDMANVVQLIVVALIAMLYAGRKTQTFAALIFVYATVQTALIQGTSSIDYDLPNAAVMLACSASMLFSIKPSDVIAKAVAFFWFMDSAKEVYDLISNGNANNETGLYIQHGTFIALSLIVWLRYHVAESLQAMNDKFYGDGVYLLIGKPRTNRSFWYFITGCSSGSVRYAIVSGMTATMYHFDTDTWSAKTINTNAVHSAAIIKLNTDADAFRERAAAHIGQRWTPKVNCATIMRPVLRSSGYRFNLLSLLPSIMVRQIITQNKRYPRRHTNGTENGH